MASNKTPAQTAFESAMKALKVKTAMGVLSDLGPSMAMQKSYPLNSSTMGTNAYKLRLGWILAALMFGTNAQTAPLLTTPYFMVAKKNISGGKAVNSFYLEMELIDKTLYLVQQGNAVRGAILDNHDLNDRDPLDTFNTLSEDIMAAIGCILLPSILGVDASDGNSQITEAVNRLAVSLQDLRTWQDVTDIPEQAKEDMYYLDSIQYVLKKLDIDFASNNSATMDEPATIPSMVSGSVVCCNCPNGWQPRFLQDNGKPYNGNVSANWTIDTARQHFAAYSANRQWTAEEKMLIPALPDDMPVMPEVMKMAKRITATHGDKNPIVNLMWRSDTGYGKSTGTQQLAAILNMPLLIMTCHPGMELQDFKSNFVPYTEDGVALDMGNVSMSRKPTAENHVQYFAEAKQHLLSLPAERREQILDAAEFFTDAFNEDPVDMMEKLTGQRNDCCFTDVCTLYSEVRSSILYEEPLMKKVQQLEASTESQPESHKEPSKPEFVHVVSNYIKALVNGYLVEIQECSRIRDSGTLVGLNEYNRPGANIPLMNGAYARRHKDAICVFTDNVGYGSCRPIDPSVIRRMGMIIDSEDLTKDQLMARVRSNTGCKDELLMKTCYDLWEKIREAARNMSINEGSISPVELENFVQAVMYDGIEALEEDLNDCVISKATSSIDEQRDLRSTLTI